MKHNENYFLNDKNCNDALSYLHKAVEIGASFQKSKNIKFPVVNFASQNKIWDNIYEKIPLNGSSLESVLSEFDKKILTHSINMNSEFYLGFPDTATSTAAQMGGILSNLMNQNIINSETASPTGTFVTILVIKWLREILGYPVSKNLISMSQVGGIATVGGVLSISTAILIARENAKRLHPTSDLNKFRIFIPKSVNHYSVERSCYWLGMSDETIVEVDVDSNFCIKPKNLTKKIERELLSGNIPIAVVAYAGNSRTMSIDDFGSISKIAIKHNIWFHIDACHGFSLAFSKKLKEKIININLADSITIDPHKVLFTPYNSSYLLIKDPSKISLISKVADICTAEPYSLGSATPFIGSIAFNSLKVWFLIKHLGKNRIGKLIEQRCELAKWFESEIINDDSFIVLNNVIINSCVFFFFPKNDRFNINQTKINKYNELNSKIHKKIFESGKFYVHSFKISDESHAISPKKFEVVCLRVMPGNPFTTKAILRKLIKEIKSVALSLHD